MPNPQGKGGVWQGRINTAFVNGFNYKYPGGGPGLARETVEQLLKIKINYYVVVDWVGFADVIDAVGGIEVTVPAPLRRVEAFNVRDGNAFLTDIPAGRQPMDSVTALAYSRYRGDALGDLARVQRQHQVMRAVMEKAAGLGWLGSAPSLWSRYRAAFDTDISASRLPGLVALAGQVGTDRITMASMAGEKGEAVRSMITSAGEDVLLPLWDKAVPIIQSVIFDRRLRAEGAQVKLLNGTAARGQTTRAAGALARYGFAPADLMLAESEAAERRADTLIVDYSGKEYTTRRIVEALGLSRPTIQRPQPSAARAAGEPDVVVIVGADAKLPPDAALSSFNGR
jgi:LCP family protein required for cell wall assembly